MFITGEDVNRLDPKADGQRLASIYEQSAVDDLNTVTCGAFTKRSTGTLNAQAQGYMARLPAWFQSVTSEDVSFSAFQGGYGNLVALKTPETGDMPISGTYGFDTLPPELVNALATLVLVKAAWMAGDNRVTSKHIEDFTISWASPSQYATPLQQVSALYRPSLDKWSLCDSSLRYGSISADENDVDPAWWWMQPAPGVQAQPWRADNVL